MWRDFPSNAFLHRYYGSDQQLPVRSMPDVHVGAHDYIRRKFGTMLFTGPKQLMVAADRDSRGFETIYTFQNGVLSGWGASILDQSDLLEPLTCAAQRELFTDISQLYQVGGFPNFPRNDWWEWVLTDKALFTKLKPEANPSGGNMPHRSLDEILTGSASYLA